VVLTFKYGEPPILLAKAGRAMNAMLFGGTLQDRPAVIEDPIAAQRVTLGTNWTGGVRWFTLTVHGAYGFSMGRHVPNEARTARPNIAAFPYMRSRPKYIARCEAASFC